eukprot:GEMP01001519.1.p1 GENE.GEMP01001519.1~~GEMP01001519.1.p1  ORF type:complete len:1401 (+),score=352.81 GEMP01001519.1:43-4245(+)
MDSQPEPDQEIRLYAVQASTATVPDRPELLSWVGGANAIQAWFSIPDPPGKDLYAQKAEVQFRVDSWISFWESVDDMDLAEVTYVEDGQWLFEVAGLQKQTNYNIRVRGVNCVGTGDASIFSVKTAGPPLAAEAVQKGRTPTEAVLQMVLTEDPHNFFPGSNFVVESASIFGWNVLDTTTTWSEEDGCYEVALPISSLMRVRVWTENKVGRSTKAFELIVTPPVVPDAPRVTVEREGTHVIEIAWTRDTPDGTTLKSVESQISKDSIFAWWEAFELEGNATPLQAQTNYIIRARVANEVGWSEWCEPVKARTADPPPTPSGFELLDQTTHSVCFQLFFDEPEDKEVPISSVSVELLWTLFGATPAVIKGDHRRLEVLDLEPDTEYLLRIWTHNAVGRCQKPLICALSTTGKPTAVENIDIISDHPKEIEVQLNAIDPVGAPVSACFVQCATSFTSWNSYVSHRHLTLPHRWICRIPDLEPATEYFIRVYTTNECGQSPMSPAYAQKTLELPPAPSELTQIACTANTVTFHCCVEDLDDAPLTRLIVECDNAKSTRASFVDFVTWRSSWKILHSQFFTHKDIPCGRVLEVTVTNLRPEYEYTVRISTINTLGWCSYASGITSLFTMTKPQIADMMQCVHVTPHGARLKWVVNGVDMAACDRCEVEIASSSVFAKWDKLYEQKATVQCEERPLDGDNNDEPLVVYQPQIHPTPSDGTPCHYDISDDSIAESNWDSSTNNSDLRSLQKQRTESTHLGSRISSDSSDDTASMRGSCPTLTVPGEKWRCKVFQLEPNTEYSIRVAMANSVGTAQFSCPITIRTSAPPPMPSQLAPGRQSLRWVVRPDPVGAPTRGCILQTDERTYFGYHVQDTVWEAEVPAGAYAVTIRAFNCVDFGPSVTEKVVIYEDAFPIEPPSSLFVLAKSTMENIWDEHAAHEDADAACNLGEHPLSARSSATDISGSVTVFQVGKRRSTRDIGSGLFPHTRCPWIRGNVCTLQEFLASSKHLVTMNAQTLYCGMEDLEDLECEVSLLWQEVVHGVEDPRLRQEFTNQHKYWITRWTNLFAEILPLLTMTFERLLYEADCATDNVPCCATQLTPVVDCLLEQVARLRVARQLRAAQELEGASTAARAQQSIVGLVAGILLPLPGMLELWAASTSLLWLNDWRNCVLALSHADATHDNDWQQQCGVTLGGSVKERALACADLENKGDDSIIVCNCGMRTLNVEVTTDEMHHSMRGISLSSIARAHPIGHAASGLWNACTSDSYDIDPIMPGSLVIIPNARKKYLRFRTKDVYLGMAAVPDAQRMVALVRLDSCIRVVSGVKAFSVINKAWAPITASVWQGHVSMYRSPESSVELAPGGEVILDIDFSSGKNMVIEVKTRGKKEEIDVTHGQYRCIVINGFI